MIPLLIGPDQHLIINGSQHITYYPDCICIKNQNWNLTQIFLIIYYIFNIKILKLSEIHYYFIFKIVYNQDLCIVE